MKLFMVQNYVDSTQKIIDWYASPAALELLSSYIAEELSNVDCWLLLDIFKFQAKKNRFVLNLGIFIF